MYILRSKSVMSADMVCPLVVTFDEGDGSQTARPAASSCGKTAPSSAS